MFKSAVTKPVCALALILALATPLLAQKLKVGEVRGYRSETSHPYPGGNASRPVVWEERVTSAGATFIRVHFTGLHLADGDYVTVSSPDGAQSWTYHGKGPHGNGDVWAFAIDGDEAIVQIHGGTRPGHGYRIDAVGHGTVDIGPRGGPFAPQPEVVCGTDGREDIACHLTEANAAQRPVARLLFVSGASQFLCTGSLVTGPNSSTLMTNNHCMDTQNEWASQQARFNYQRTTCGGSVDEPASNYSGGTLLKTNKKLDYSLGTLLGNPEATWGELTPTTSQAAVGNLLWFIQHPGGRRKEIGYWEDEAQSLRCKVDRINQTYGGSQRQSQMAYGCDSEGGSSGSPIVSAATGRVIGLHHFGGVNNSPCLNAATEMPEICANAGALLSCASN